MASLQRDTNDGTLLAVWRTASGDRVKISTGEFVEERAWKKAAALEAEARFWEDQAAGVWQRLADACFSPRYLHAVFIGRSHIIFPRFRALLTEYEKAPEVTRQRLYLETIGTVLPRIGSKVILDADARQFLPLMNLQQLAPAPPGADR